MMAQTGVRSGAAVKGWRPCCVLSGTLLGLVVAACIGVENGGRVTRESREMIEAPPVDGVRINWVKKVYSDEQWNGWPDIAKWKGKYYICFTNGTAHGSRDHKIMLTSSEDLDHWSRPQVALGPPGDHLESFFLETDEKLFIHASWRNGTATPHTNIISSNDGTTWRERRQGYLDGYIFWGQSAHGGKFYVAAHIDPPESTNYLLVSEDGEGWEQVSLISDHHTTETVLCFLDSGELMALSRRAPRDFALACFAAPPFAEWRCIKTDTVLEGAALAKIAGRVVAIGRCSEFEGQASIDHWYDESRRTGIFFYQDGALKRQAFLPSGGDTGYPGILRMGNDEALVVYYSEHERMDNPDYRYKHCGAIYLASITVSG